MQKIEFKDLPDTTTPINAYNMNLLQDYIHQANVYSLEEIDTGKTWWDGKTIYRKVVRFNPNTNETQTSFSHGISNIEEILPTSSCILHRINGLFIPFSMCYPNSSEIIDWSIGWQISKTQIVTWIGSSMRAQIDTNNYGCVAVLEYTKTSNQITNG